MEDIGLFKQGCKWLLSQKQMFLGIQSAFWCFKDFLVERHWPMLYRGCVNLGKSLFLLLLLWRDCIVRGFRSSLGLGPTVLFVVMWSCFLSLTSITCLAYVLLMLVSSLHDDLFLYFYFFMQYNFWVAVISSFGDVSIACP